LSERGRDFLVGGVFLALVAGLVVAGWMGRSANGAPAAPGGVVPESERAEVPGRGLPDGTMAPALELPRIDGGTASLGAYRGRPVIVNIWATWCPPCVREMPSLQRVYDRFRDQGLEILAVAVDDVPGERQADGRIQGVVSQFVEQYGLTFPVVVDPTGGTEDRFGTEFLPTTVLIDRTGRIVTTAIGGREWDEPPYLEAIKALMEEN
jgi:thiol-disulfide isomerase/thioredoxin